jgi:uracil-DNA glycosylase
MTTFHPETLLKSPQSKKLAWTDLQAFRDRLNAS